jgi:hypothetical protein
MTIRQSSADAVHTCGQLPQKKKLIVQHAAAHTAHMVFICFTCLHTPFSIDTNFTRVFICNGRLQLTASNQKHSQQTHRTNE